MELRGEDSQKLSRELGVRSARGGEQAALNLLAISHSQHDKVASRVADHLVGDLTEDPLPGVGVALPAHHQQIGAMTLGRREYPLMHTMGDDEVGLHTDPALSGIGPHPLEQGLLVVSEPEPLMDRQLPRHLHDGGGNDAPIIRFGQRHREVEQVAHRVRVVDRNEHGVLRLGHGRPRARHQHLGLLGRRLLLGVGEVDEQAEEDPAPGHIPGQRLEVELVDGEKNV